MFNIRDFFGKIQGSFGQEIAARTAVREALARQLGIDVPIEMISYKAGAVVLSGVSSSARNEIFMKKSALIQEINSKQSIHPIRDIR